MPFLAIYRFFSSLFSHRTNTTAHAYSIVSASSSASASQSETRSADALSTTHTLTEAHQLRDRGRLPSLQEVIFNRLFFDEESDFTSKQVHNLLQVDAPEAFKSFCRYYVIKTIEATNDVEQVLTAHLAEERRAEVHPFVARARQCDFFNRLKQQVNGNQGGFFSSLVREDDLFSVQEHREIWQWVRGVAEQLEQNPVFRQEVETWRAVQRNIFSIRNSLDILVMDDLSDDIIYNLFVHLNELPLAISSMFRRWYLIKLLARLSAEEDIQRIQIPQILQSQREEILRIQQVARDSDFIDQIHGQISNIIDRAAADHVNFFAVLNFLHQGGPISSAASQEQALQNEVWNWIVTVADALGQDDAFCKATNRTIQVFKRVDSMRCSIDFEVDRVLDGFGSRRLYTQYLKQQLVADFPPQWRVAFSRLYIFCVLANLEGHNLLDDAAETVLAPFREVAGDLNAFFQEIAANFHRHTFQDAFLNKLTILRQTTTSNNPRDLFTCFLDNQLFPEPLANEGSTTELGQRQYEMWEMIKGLAAVLATMNSPEFCKALERYTTERTREPFVL